MELLLALPGVITSCLLVYVLVRLHAQQAEEREELRVEIRMAQTELTALARSHAEQLERVSEAHRSEVANLCQRIQAPEQAVVDHSVQVAPADPPVIDFDDDLALMDEAQRKMREFAEELAAER